MLKKTIVLGTVALLAATVTNVLGAEPAVGQKATFGYTTTDGRVVTPQSVKGHIIIFDFWATWCGPCMQMAPDMVALNKKYADQGVQIIGVSLDQDVKTMEAGAKKHGFTWPQICDGKVWDSAFAKAWGVKSIPHCVILSPDGVVLWSGHPGNIAEPLKTAVATYPYDPKAKDKEKEKEKAAAEPAHEKPVAAKEKPAEPTVAPAILTARMAMADKDKAAGRNVAAYDAYKWVETHAPKSDEATKAQAQVQTYEADPVFEAAYKKVQKNRDASSTLWLAQSLEKNGKTQDAIGYYKKIISDFADTPSAQTAKDALAALK